MQVILGKSGKDTQKRGGGWREKSQKNPALDYSSFLKKHTPSAHNGGRGMGVRELLKRGGKACHRRGSILVKKRKTDVSLSYQTLRQHVKKQNAGT